MINIVWLTNDNKYAILDSNISQFVRNTIEVEKIRKNITVYVGQSAIINAFRLAVLQGLIELNNIVLWVNNKAIHFTENGLLDNEPDELLITHTTIVQLLQTRVKQGSDRALISESCISKNGRCNDPRV